MHKQIKVTFALLVFFCTITTVFTQNDAILNSEQARWDAQVAKDIQKLDLLLDEDLHYIHSNTLIETKADFIHSIESAKIVYQEMNLKQHQVKRYKKTAVITGLVEVVGLFKSNQFTVDLYYTSVYRKKKGQWLLVNWQSTSKKKS